MTSGVLIAGGLIAGKVAVAAALERYLPGDYLLGVDGTATIEPPPKPIAVREVGGFWTSVGAGLTVAGVLYLFGFVNQLQQPRRR